jgi:hypothetical protein
MTNLKENVLKTKLKTIKIKDKQQLTTISSWNRPLLDQANTTLAKESKVAFALSSVSLIRSWLRTIKQD